MSLPRSIIKSEANPWECLEFYGLLVVTELNSNGSHRGQRLRTLWKKIHMRVLVIMVNSTSLGNSASLHEICLARHP